MSTEGSRKETLESLDVETTKEKAYGTAALAANLVPFVGGIASQILSGRQAEIR